MSWGVQQRLVVSIQTAISRSNSFCVFSHSSLSCQPLLSTCSSSSKCVLNCSHERTNNAAHLSATKVNCFHFYPLIHSLTRFASSHCEMCIWHISSFDRSWWVDDGNVKSEITRNDKIKGMCRNHCYMLLAYNDDVGERKWTDFREMRVLYCRKIMQNKNIIKQDEPVDNFDGWCTWITCAQQYEDTKYVWASW